MYFRLKTGIKLTYQFFKMSNPSSLRYSETETLDSAGTEPEQCLQESSRLSPFPGGRISIKMQNVVKIFRTGIVDVLEDATALNNLNLELFEGELYALMGPSGAGKTTAMLAIIGLIKLDSGKIFVCGKRIINGEPNRLIGFLPQECAMYTDFTVKESFYYFGQQNGMSIDDIDEAIKLAQEVLDFNEWDQEFRTLSSGKQRLACFGSAILHNPKVVVLDEPTIGLDFPTAKKIWDFMRILRRRGMTFLIITHDADEANLADRMGLMVGGKVILEGTVSELKLLFEKENLDEVFYEACTNDQFEVEIKTKALKFRKVAHNPKLSKVNEWLQKNHIFLTSPEVNEKKSGVLDNGETQENLENQDDATGGWEDVDANDNWNPLTTPTTALNYKNWLNVRHSKWAMLFVALLPAMQIFVIIHSVGMTPYINVGVFNYELPHGTMECPVLDTCAEYRDAGLWSCMLMHQTETQRLNYIYYNNEAEAKEVILSGSTDIRLTAYIGFNKTYTNSFRKSMEGGDMTEDEGIAFQIKMGYDASDPILKDFFLKAMYASYFDFSRNVKNQCNYESTVGTNLFANETFIFESGEFFGTYLSTSSLVGVLWFFPIVSGASTVIIERNNGIYTRSLIAGTAPIHMLFTNCLRPIFYSNIQILVWAAVVILLEGMRIHGSFILLMGLATGIGMIGETIGFIYAILLDTHLSASIFVLGTYIPILMISGIMWPIESVRPTWIQPVIWRLPASYSARAFREIVHRGLDFMNEKVYLGFVSLSIWLVVVTIVFLLVAKRDKRIKFGV